MLSPRLFEDIVLLEMMTQVPANVAKKAVATRPAQQNGAPRELNEQREREIADSFAFISAMSEHPGCVLAVCLEELEEPNKALLLRLAMNTPNLEPVKRGLEELVKILERVARQEISGAVAESAFFEAVLRLNRNRILCRLRSKHARREKLSKDKKPFIPRLPEKLQLATGDVDLTEIKKQVQQLDSSFRKLEALDSSTKESPQLMKLLSNIVNTSSDLASGASSLAALIDTVPVVSRSGQYDTGAAMQDHVGKVGRYWSATRYLVAAARKLQVFKSITICAVSKPLTKAAPCLHATQSSLRNVLDRSSPSLPGKAMSQRLSSFKLDSGVRLASQEAEHIFQQNKSQAAKNGKVHAEIQLVLYYDAHCSRRPPRAISASKIPCLLCSLFIAAHGRFQLQETHGKLYKTWALPTATNFGAHLNAQTYRSIISSLVKITENAIATALMVGRQVPVLPCESALNLYVWPQSVTSLVSGGGMQVASAVGLAPALPEVGHRFNGNGELPVAGAGGSVQQPQQSARLESSNVVQQASFNASYSHDQLPASHSNLTETTHPVDTDRTQVRCLESNVSHGNTASRPALLDAESPETTRSGQTCLSSSHRTPSARDIATGDGGPATLQDQPVQRPSDSSSKVPSILAPSQADGPIEAQHAVLTPGQSCSVPLIQGGLPIRVGTPRMRLELSWEDVLHLTEELKEGQGELSRSLERRPACYVSITSLAAVQELPGASTSQATVIDLQKRAAGPELLLQDGSAASSKSLFLANRGDLVRIKFSFV